MPSPLTSLSTFPPLLSHRYDAGAKRSASSIAMPIVGMLPVQNNVLSDPRFALGASLLLAVVTGQRPPIQLSDEAMKDNKRYLLFPHHADLTKKAESAGWSALIQKKLKSVARLTVPDGLHSLTRGGVIRFIEDALPASRVESFLKWAQGTKAVRFFDCMVVYSVNNWARVCTCMCVCTCVFVHTCDYTLC